MDTGLLLARLKAGLLNPRLALSWALTFDKKKAVRRFAAQVCGAPEAEIAGYQAEFQALADLRREIEAGVGETFVGQTRPYGAEALYLVHRCLKPESVVETGVASGVSSSWILAALEKNGKGRLYSVDLPNNETAYMPQLGMQPISILPKGRDPGFAVPRRLRGRWQLILGDSRVELPALLARLGGIDLFFHDSEHTVEAMLFEYRCAWPALRPGGVLLSDDVTWNTAFEDFAAQTGSSPAIIFTIGGLRKA